MRQQALAVIYSTAIAARNGWWRVSKPLLMGVRVVIIHKGQVLLVRHRSGMRPWSLPGGGVERREPLTTAAARECREEAGATIQIDHLLGTFDNFFLGVSNYVVVFVADQIGERKPFFSLEIAEACYFATDALPANIELGSARRIAEHRAGRIGIAGTW